MPHPQLFSLLRHHPSAPELSIHRPQKPYQHQSHSAAVVEFWRIKFRFTIGPLHQSKMTAHEGHLLARFRPAFLTHLMRRGFKLLHLKWLKVRFPLSLMGIHCRLTVSLMEFDSFVLMIALALSHRCMYPSLVESQYQILAVSKGACTQTRHLWQFKLLPPLPMPVGHLPVGLKVRMQKPSSIL